MAHSTASAPLRGTQSLVGVMGFVWRHPTLTLLELVWRWCTAIPLLFLLYRSLAPTVDAIPLDTAALGSMTFLEPVRSAEILARQLRPFVFPVEATAKWWIPLALLLWTLAATFGRTAIYRRAQRLPARTDVPTAARVAVTSPFSLHFLAYTFSRALAFLLLLALWLFCLRAFVRSTVTHPLYAGAEPNLVLLSALAVLLTLALFMLWALTVWSLDLVPLQRLTGLTLPNTGQRRELRSKLIETNLVMGIVRVALFVLAMTFSASPLPFESRETQAYINVWWIGVATLYVLGSDFFHVVRRVTYLRLLQSIATGANASADAAS